MERVGVGDLKGELALRPGMGNSVARVKVILVLWVLRAVLMSTRSRSLQPFKKVAKPSLWLLRNVLKVSTSILVTRCLLRRKSAMRLCGRLE